MIVLKAKGISPTHPPKNKNKKEAKENFSKGWSARRQSQLSAADVKTRIKEHKINGLAERASPLITNTQMMFSPPTLLPQFSFHRKTEKKKRKKKEFGLNLYWNWKTNILSLSSFHFFFLPLSSREHLFL